MKNSCYILLWITFISMMSCTPTIEKTMTNKEIAFIGTYTQKEGHVDGKGAGVSIYETGAQPEDWKLLHSFSDIINPSYICLSPKHPIIYAVSEQGPNVPAPKSVIKVIQYDPESFEMKELQQVSALGHAPCYISTDRDGNFLSVANYVSGNIIFYKINEDGSLQNGIAQNHEGRGPHDRQEAPHAHYIKQHPIQQNSYAVDLGLDLVIQYHASDSGFKAKDSIKVNAGSGPRHLAWHPDGKTAYVLGELSGTIEAWNWDSNNKERLQSIELGLDQKFTGAADIHISKDGRFIYASLRGDFDEIVVLSIDPASKELTILQRIPAGGSAPRNFALSPDENYIAVASQNSDVIALFARDAKTGLLEETPKIVSVKTPVCIVFK